MASREEQLCQWALEAGFDRAGIATLEPSQYEPAFRGWIERGDHAGMEWLGRRIELRMDSATRLEGARSALCVAMHYPARSRFDDGAGPDPAVDTDPSDLWEGVARYAHGVDYHTVLMQRLRELGERIERSFPGTRTRSYVDTGPLLERELGQRAGLGRIAKNTMLLSKQGSYFLLGEILLTLELEPSDDVGDLCGSCTRCLEACPTGALPEPYRLDSRRCISYWTIEHRGEFPPGVAELTGDWVFGCDICQQVCPWNSDRNPRREQGSHPELDLSDQRAALDLVGMAQLERPDYVDLFRGSAMKRPKLEGLRRNAIAVLTNQVLQTASREGASPDGVREVSATIRDITQSLLVRCESAEPQEQPPAIGPEQIVRAAAIAALARLIVEIEKFGIAVTAPEDLVPAALLELERSAETDASRAVRQWLTADPVEAMGTAEPL